MDKSSVQIQPFYSLSHVFRVHEHISWPTFIVCYFRLSQRETPWQWKIETIEDVQSVDWECKWAVNIEQYTLCFVYIHCTMYIHIQLYWYNIHTYVNEVTHIVFVNERTMIKSRLLLIKCQCLQMSSIVPIEWKM